MEFPKIIKQHRKIFLIGIILIIISIAFFAFKAFNNKNIETSYSVSQIQETDFIISLSGAGQLAATEQLNLTSETEGELTALYVSKGDEVENGDVLAKIDNSDYIIKSNEAYITYELAKLDLEELLSPTDEADITKAENSLKNEQESLIKTEQEQETAYREKNEEQEQLEEDLEEAYEDAYTEIADTFLDFSDVITELYKLIFSYEITDEINTFEQMNSSYLEVSYKTDDYAEEKIFEDLILELEEYYYLSEDKYDECFNEYKNVSRYSETNEIKELLDDTIDATRQASDTLKTAMNTLDLWCENRTNNDLEIFTIILNYETSLKNKLSSVNSHLTSLLNASSSINNKIEEIENIEEDLIIMDLNYPIDIVQIERSIEEKENALNELIEGATESEIKNQELTVSQKLNTYNEAIEELNNCNIIAPFDGVIAEINYSIGDDISSGKDILTIITDQKMIEISLNEIDITSVEVGQKANIIFDAFDSETFIGEVAEVDILGMADQGVVSYNVKILFDTDSELIKVGMSGNVEIILYENKEAIVVPISSIKTIKQNNFIEVLSDNEELIDKSVTIGESNDVYTEILEGLVVGDRIISSKITTQEKTEVDNTNNSSLFTNSTEGPPERMMK